MVSLVHHGAIDIPEAADGDFVDPEQSNILQICDCIGHRLHARIDVGSIQGDAHVH